MRNTSQVKNKSDIELSKRDFFREASVVGAGLVLFGTSAAVQAQTKGSFTMVSVELKTQPGKAQALCSEVFGPAFSATRNYDGFIELTVYIEQALDTVLIIEKWKTKEHYEKYLKWRIDTGLVEALAPYAAAAPVIRFFDPRPE